MQEVQKRISPEMDMVEFRSALLDGGKTFPNIYLAEDEILPEYRRILKEIDAKHMPKFFNKYPEKFPSCKIQAVPEENQESAALASYMPGTPSKSGYFQVNMFLHKEKRKSTVRYFLSKIYRSEVDHLFFLAIHQSVALTLHEANPGIFFKEKADMLCTRRVLI